MWTTCRCVKDVIGYTKNRVYATGRYCSNIANDDEFASPIIERVNIADSKEKRCTYCDKTGHVVERCFKKLGKKCWLCNETSHMSRACPNKTSKNELGVTQTPVSTPLNN